jgi:hypothetical protein
MTTKLEWLQQQKDLTTSMSREQLLSYLNTPKLITNPAVITPVPKMPTLKEVVTVIASINPAEVGAVSETEAYKRILDAITQNNIEWIKDNTQVLLFMGAISQPSYDAIISKLEETHPDPNYQAQIARTPAEQAGFDTVTASEIYSL